MHVQLIFRYLGRVLEPNRPLTFDLVLRDVQSRPERVARYGRNGVERDERSWLDRGTVDWCGLERVLRLQLATVVVVRIPQRAEAPRDVRRENDALAVAGRLTG